MKPVKLFISYSHKDEAFRKELQAHLTILERKGVVWSWSDRQIDAGREWASAIDASLESAGLILLLVSADFIASEYIWDVELKQAIARHDAGKAVVIPIIVRACVWKDAPFARMQALPRNARPIASWPDRDEAWTDVATGIRKTVEKFAGGREPTGPGTNDSSTPQQPNPANARHGLPESSGVEKALQRQSGPSLTSGPVDKAATFRKRLLSARGLDELKRIQYEIEYDPDAAHPELRLVKEETGRAIRVVQELQTNHLDRPARSRRAISLMAVGTLVGVLTGLTIWKWPAPKTCTPGEAQECTPVGSCASGGKQACAPAGRWDECRCLDPKDKNLSCDQLRKEVQTPTDIRLDCNSDGGRLGITVVYPATMLREARGVSERTRRVCESYKAGCTVSERARDLDQE